MSTRWFWENLLIIAKHLPSTCPEKQAPPEGYICKRCNQSGHFIRDCPTRDELGDTGGKKPKEGYICRACGSEKHLIEDCLVVKEQRETRGGRGRGKREEAKEIRRTFSTRCSLPQTYHILADECWFCLSNPNLAYVAFCFSNGQAYFCSSKHLIVSLGDEAYMTFTKGQLPSTSSSDSRMKELFPVPGGGQVLITPITHHPTLLSLPEDEKDSVLKEIEK